MTYDDLLKGRFSESQRAYFVTTVLREREQRHFSGQRAFYDHALRQDEDVQGVARYIVANPLRAGLVENIGDYPLWDAIWL
jgi:REP element-mobilizing transposase RayT